VKKKCHISVVGESCNDVERERDMLLACGGDMHDEGTTHYVFLCRKQIMKLFYVYGAQPKEREKCSLSE